MQFCSECHNMYYLKIQDEDENIGNTLIYYCRNCGHEDTTLSTTNICVSDTQLRSSEKKYTHIVNEYTKYDPTLPRINTIKCPNQECSSNEMGGGGRKKTVVGEAGPEASEAGPEAKAASKAKTSKAASEAASKSKAETSKSKAETSKSKAAQASLAAAEENLKTILEEEDAAEANAVISDSDPNNNREVIYIRYDDTNMKYVYLCVHCDTTWRTDNRL